jgi:hypothetical protein
MKIDDKVLEVIGGAVRNHEIDMLSLSAEYLTKRLVSAIEPYLKDAPQIEPNRLLSEIDGVLLRLKTGLDASLYAYSIEKTLEKCRHAIAAYLKETQGKYTPCIDEGCEYYGTEHLCSKPEETQGQPLPATPEADLIASIKQEK